MKALKISEADRIRREKRAPACPTETTDHKALAIAGFLERSQADPGLDVLAVEWERLNDGARICRTGRR